MEMRILFILAMRYKHLHSEGDLWAANVAVETEKRCLLYGIVRRPYSVCCIE